MLAPMLAGGVGATLLSRLRKKPQGAQPQGFDPMQYARTGASESAARVGASRDDLASAIGGFDPAAYTQAAAGAMYSGMNEQRTTADANRNAGLNARGLFRSNLGGAAADRGFNEQLARAMAGLSMQQAGLEQNKTQMMAGMHDRDRDDASRYEDMSLGLHMADRDQKAADKASKRSMWGSLAGAGLTAAGMALGGPGGAAIGGGIGKMVGGLFNRRRA
jgi:hypothetical protein